MLSSQAEARDWREVGGGARGGGGGEAEGVLSSTFKVNNGALQKQSASVD